MNSPKHDVMQENSKNPRVLEVFNALRANPKISIIDALFNCSELIVENYDIHIVLSEAEKHIDVLELKLAALSWNKPSDKLKVVLNVHDLKSRINEMEALIKGAHPALTIDEATNGWAKMNVHLIDATTKLMDEEKANAELATQLAAAQRGILTSHDVSHLIINKDLSHQFSATNPRIKFLAKEFSKTPGLTLEMAVDRWAAFSLGFDELRLELERYKEDSQRKRFATNANAESALDLQDKKVARFNIDSNRSIKAVEAKRIKTSLVKDAVLRWCDEHRREHLYSDHSANEIVNWHLLKDNALMKTRKASTLITYVLEWEKKNNFTKRTKIK